MAGLPAAAFSISRNSSSYSRFSPHAAPGKGSSQLSTMVNRAAEPAPPLPPPVLSSIPVVLLVEVASRPPRLRCGPGCIAGTWGRQASALSLSGDGQKSHAEVGSARAGTRPVHVGEVTLESFFVAAARSRRRSVGCLRARESGANAGAPAGPAAVGAAAGRRSSTRGAAETRAPRKIDRRPGPHAAGAARARQAGRGADARRHRLQRRRRARRRRCAPPCRSSPSTSPARVAATRIWSMPPPRSRAICSASSATTSATPTCRSRCRSTA